MEDVNIGMDQVILEDMEPVRGKKKKKFTLPIILIVFIAIILVIVKLDVGKVSSKYLEPKIKNVPIVRHILPKTKAKGLYADHTKEQLIAIIENQENELEMAQEEIEVQADEIVDLQNKIADLEVFEDEYSQFREDKYEFDQNVATLNEEEFMRYYQQMYPENAQEAYSNIIRTQEMTKEQRQYSLLISEMDESSAAKVLENLFQTDMDIIISILSNMETESASAILDEMDSQIAARVVKQLSPE
ncbi:MAG: hypothetical protein GX366_00275 [Epulopiscium sp.]|nr:hypothetical protein [Candidatus Epulonipiscium sp.]